MPMRKSRFTEDRHSFCGHPPTRLVYSRISAARETHTFPVRLGRFAPRFIRHP
jgi:hypothetical protein